MSAPEIEPLDRGNAILGLLEPVGRFLAAVVTDLEDEPFAITGPQAIELGLELLRDTLDVLEKNLLVPVTDYEALDRRLRSHERPIA